MTRVTLGQFKAALRDPALRTGAAAGFPTPMTVANSAVRTFHRGGALAAHQYLNRTFDRSPYWGPTGPAGPRGWANSIRQCLDLYMSMASQDARRWLPMTVSCDVDVGPHTIGVKLDVVLLDGNGYVARIPLWDKVPLAPHEARTLAGPIIEALEVRLGPGRAVGVDFWHLRTGEALHVSSNDVRGHVGDVVRVVDGYLSEE